MLKKMIAILLACAMTLCCALAETAPADPAEAFAGQWADPIYGRAELSIMPVDAEGAQEYAILLTWGSSAAEHRAWTMRATFEDGALVYQNGEMADITAADDGGEESVVVHWQDARGRFTMNEDGKLLWEDSREETAGELCFEPQIKFAPDVEALTERFIRPIADLQPGAAGYSLKLAAAVNAATRFAWSESLWNADVPALRKNLRAALSQLDASARQGFDSAFEDVAALAQSAFADYESVRGDFSDAGVDGDMSLIAAQLDAAQSWKTLVKAVEAEK